MQKENNDPPPPSPQQLQAKKLGAGGQVDVVISIFVACLRRQCVVCRVLTST